MFKRNAEELSDKIDQLRYIEQTEQKLTEQQKQEYEELIKAKEDMDKKYLALRKQQIFELSREERLERYKQEVEEIQREARAQKALNSAENENNSLKYDQRNREIDRDTKNKLNESREKYGLTNLDVSIDKNSKLLQGISNLLSGKSGSASSIMESLFGKEVASQGIMSLLRGAAGTEATTSAAGSAAAGGASAAAGPIAIALVVLQTIAKIVGKINEIVAKGVQEAVDLRSSYMAPINTRLQGLMQQDANYYDLMTDWSKENQGEFGLLIGRWNAFVDRQKYVEQLNTLVQAGIAYNAEERALLQTMSDKLVTTFDVMDASLTRLVRLQQRDMTYAAMGSESLLTQFLNRFSAIGGIADTSYLSDVYDSVSATLLDAVAKLNADDATAFSYEVQKWLGALYSLGLSQEGVQSLAKGITYLQTGNVSELSSNQQLQYIYSAAAERAGLSIGDILIQGLDIETTNLLLQNVVTLLQDIYNNSTTNAVQSAWTNITGMSIADMKAMTNVSDNFLAYISSEHQDWVSSWEETYKQLELAQTAERTHSSEAIQNIINNALLSVGERISSTKFSSFGVNKNETSYSGSGEVESSEVNTLTGNGWIGTAINDLLGIGGMNKYSVYYAASLVGGTLGSVVQSMVMLPELIKEINSEIKEFTNNQEAINKLDFSGFDEKIFRSAGSVTRILEKLDKDRIIESRIRSSPNISESAAYENWQIVANLAEQQSEFERLFITMGLGLQENNYQMTQRLDELTRIQDRIENPQFDYANSIGITETFITDLGQSQSELNSSVLSLASQAEDIASSSAVVSNESIEDKNVIEQATDIQEYLFENERLIRVSLANVEEIAGNQLDRYTVAKERKEISQQTLDIMRDKVPVDVIDNDVNSIIDHIYNVRLY